MQDISPCLSCKWLDHKNYSCPAFPQENGAIFNVWNVEYKKDCGNGVSFEKRIIWDSENT